MQAIKDQFWPHRQAVEIYPPAAEVVDVAPMRWLWILPAGEALPFDLRAQALAPEGRRYCIGCGEPPSKCDCDPTDTYDYVADDLNYDAARERW